MSRHVVRHAPRKAAPCILWLAAALAAAAEPAAPALFLFEKTLAAPAEAVRNLGSVALDGDVLAATDNAYANLRVLDAGSAEVPWLARTRRINRAVVTESTVGMQTVSLQTLPDNSIRVILAKQPDQDRRRPSALVVQSGLQNFEKQVTIEGSLDGTVWTVLRERQPIFDYSRYMDVRNTRVEFPASACGHFRVVISNITEKAMSPLVQIARDTRQGGLFSEVEHTAFRNADFRVNRLDFIEKTSTGRRAEAVLRDYPAGTLAVVTNAKERTTVVRFESLRAPLTGITLRAADPNFSRAFLLEASDEAAADDAWRPILSGRLTRVSAGGYSMDETRIDLPSPQRYRWYRLTLNNLDSPPLNVQGIATRGETHEILFFTGAPRNYRVLYGGREIPAPQYDIGTVLQNAQTAETDEYRAGAQRANPAYRSEKSRPPLSARALLVIAVTVMVLALGWVIVKAARKMELPEEP